MILSRRKSVERQSVERAELESVATLHALTLHAPRKKSGGPKLFLHIPWVSGALQSLLLYRAELDQLDGNLLSNVGTKGLGSLFATGLAWQVDFH